VEERVGDDAGLLNAVLAGTVEKVIYKSKSNELKSEAAKTEESLAALGDVDPALEEIRWRSSTSCKTPQNGGEVHRTPSIARSWIWFV